MKLVALAAALLCGLVGVALAQEPPALPAVTLPAPDGPIRLELDIRVEGRSPKVAWDQFLIRLFDFFDRNADGLLAEGECARLPQLPVSEKRELAFPFSALDRDANGSVSRSELTEYCSVRGYSPAVIRSELPSTDDVRLSSVFEQWFDENHDGIVTATELQRVAQTLSRYDLDEDGAVSFQELLLSFETESPQNRSVAAGHTSTPARALRLQVNIDGIHPTVVADAGATHVMTAKTTLGSLTRFLEPKNTWMLTLDSRRQAPNVKSASDFLTAQFQNALDSRTELTLQKIRQDSALSGLTELAPMADCNGDQLLSLEELQSYTGLVAAAFRSQIWVTVSDHASNLFSALDENADGRLSFVELANIEQVLGAKETIQTLPTQFTVTFGAAPIRSWGGMMIPSVPKRVQAPAKQAATGPKWYQALDRNRDGIVSIREFVGPPEVFRRLDADGDRMISVDEATSSTGR